VDPFHFAPFSPFIVLFPLDALLCDLHQGYGKRLTFHVQQIAQQLSMQDCHNHQTNSSGRAFLAFRVISTISPLRKRITRSAIKPMAELCVITATSVCSSSLMRAKTSSTSFAVGKSSAPVGSSQSNMSGVFAIARAIATRCCSPPESWEVK
jgi:hypothetical protein